MRCAWQELLNILPQWMRSFVDEQGKETLQELRLRIGLAPELITAKHAVTLDRKVTSEDLSYIINAASRYSPWAATSMAKGYLTTSGGHRIGLCGEVVPQKPESALIRTPRSLCIRVARDFPGIAEKAASIKGSVLIIGSPGAGKTTLLRDMIRQRSNGGCCTAVVDERGELFPNGFDTGLRTDILTGCPKERGIDILLKVMGPECIAVDEITSEGDCEALLRAGWCGVSLLATAHAQSAEDLLRRPIYHRLVQCGLFESLLVLSRDKSWQAERMCAYI